LAGRKIYSVYVIELSKKIWTDSEKFRDANIQFRGLKDCLYVGMTSLDPKKRYQQHKKGTRSKKGHKLSSYFVEKYGLFLRPSMYSGLNPMTKGDATKMEEELALKLRKEGFAVWWN
jgi:predicted GIY-YIG superfamily endonuclease